MIIYKRSARDESSGIEKCPSHITISWFEHIKIYVYVWWMSGGFGILNRIRWLIYDIWPDD
ncbi:MAG: hypothetical protein ACFFG0_03940 [Candidatus Thorarchaeota archaeon]